MNRQLPAVGMIETLGIPALVAAADAAAKTADVQVTAYEKADAGIVTIYLLGDVAAVKAAVEAGEAEARRIGTLLGSHVIPRPDDAVLQFLRSLIRREDPGPADEQQPADGQLPGALPAKGAKSGSPGPATPSEKVKAGGGEAGQPVDPLRNDGEGGGGSS
ncbi:carbon dioxide concentrating mechanism/carboxysome shell protein [Paenibacillus darwinianus]|uniref:Carbon dioxide concentrating mechanism/carboxysome shell protein n=1 Tax=Paenibacillus darwinianus TaxID=1380763 RepID=A0A9W5S1E9_9BACL|nr:BMC domain-containing protein [Paenibacillus darwinianus]EXX87795.1 carbon dioxide concentrating mechanism/carboxysome shell protein [Paenibacillus darwinianus]EXX88120.1 carbon dioxide concentrating mechanism/carboxysome shell protein [Paenibacillus darwinianus]EXX89048.1 carbon dioxide concentrating mechanism/carboxysome shell protein [Paenibacillus darwinianus]